MESLMILLISIVNGLAIFGVSMAIRESLLDHIASRKFVAGKENYEL